MRKFLLLMLLFPLSLFAQTPSFPVYNGTVTNSLGQAVPNATVIVLSGTITGAQSVNTTIQPGSPLATVCATQSASGAIIAPDPYCNTTVNQTTLPLKADGSGNISFAAAAGWYVLQIYGPGVYNQQITQISLGGGGSTPSSCPGGNLYDVQLNSPLGTCSGTDDFLFDDSPGVSVLASMGRNNNSNGNLDDIFLIGQGLNASASTAQVYMFGSDLQSNNDQCFVYGFEIDGCLLGDGLTQYPGFYAGYVGANFISRPNGPATGSVPSLVANYVANGVTPALINQMACASQGIHVGQVQQCVDGQLNNWVGVSLDGLGSVTVAGDALIVASAPVTAGDVVCWDSGAIGQVIDAGGTDPSGCGSQVVAGVVISTDPAYYPQASTSLPLVQMSSWFSSSSAGATSWNSLTDPTAGLTLSMGSHVSTFNYQSSASLWKWVNTNSASGVANQNSPEIDLYGNYWTGLAGAADGWSIQDVLGSGTNPTSSLTFQHVGSSGNSLISVPALTANGDTPPAGQIVSGASGFCIQASCITAWPSGGGGGISTISVGNLSPLFTTTVTNPTSTPAVTYALSNAAQNSVFAGPPTGGSGAPSFQTAPTISAANMMSFPTFNQNTTGNAATASASDHSISSCPGGEFTTGLSTTWALTCAAAGSGITYPPSGIPLSIGSAWGSSYSVTGSGNVVLSTSPTLVTPNLGTPSALVLTNATGAPTWNQNTTGTASNLSGTPTLPNGTKATTQACSDNSQNLATTAFALNCIGAGIANSTVTIGIGTINANTCGSNIPITMTGLTSSNTLTYTATADTSAIVGWGAVGGLVLRPWPSANTANVRVCNQTGSSITTSGAVTFNISAR